MDGSPSQPIEAAKRELRAAVRSRITAADDAARRDADARIRDRIAALEVFDRGGVVCGFLPFRDEPDLTPFLASLRRRGVRVALPEVCDGPRPELRMLEIADEGQLTTTRPSRLGTRIPIGGVAIATEEVGAVLVPGVAFDGEGRRLGRGGGFFDAFLARLAPAVPRIGVAYECQVVERVPAEAHDAKVDWLCTESRTLEVRRVPS